MEEIVEVRPGGGAPLVLAEVVEGTVITGQNLLAEANRMLLAFFTRYLPQVPRDDPDRLDLEDLCTLCRDLGGCGLPR